MTGLPPSLYVRSVFCSPSGVACSRADEVDRWVVVRLTCQGVSAVESGLDMTMPGDIVFNSGTTFFGANLTAAVNNGTIPRSRVDVSTVLGVHAVHAVWLRVIVC